MRFAYFPGCNAESTALEYNQSVKETFSCLEVALDEIPDWNCCGASSGHVVDRELALALPGRNLALAEQMSLDMITPCPACYVRQKIAQAEIQKDHQLKGKMEKNLGVSLKFSQKTKHVLEVLCKEIEIGFIRRKIKKPLKGLKVVTYYGCYLIRPPEIADFDDRENPVTMDEIIDAAGAEVIDWSSKIDCCGANLSLTTAGVVKELVSKLVANAHDSGAEAIVTACPLCQSNLDLYQTNYPTLPVLFFSELTALALGSSNANNWFGKHMVNPVSLFNRLGLI